jgi:hypothetical protein
MESPLRGIPLAQSDDEPNQPVVSYVVVVNYLNNLLKELSSVFQLEQAMSGYLENSPIVAISR